MPPSLPHPASTRPARRSILLALAVSLTLFAVIPATPTRAATTATQAEALLLGWINKDRSAAGLTPLRRWARLAGVADLRADRAADLNSLSHTAAGDLGAQLNARGVSWYRYGEALGYTYAAWTRDAARDLYVMWKRSAPHWALLMSDRFNYAGVGLVHRSDGATFGSIVLTESRDHSPARSRITSTWRSGNDIRWTWKGWDLRLQTHTAGLRDFDVQYRVGSGSWRTIRNDTGRTSITLNDRARGRTYSLRVRATDRRGNVGKWTSAAKIYVP